MKIGDKLSIHCYKHNGKIDRISGEAVVIDIKDDYISLIANSIRLGNRKIKLVIDCGNGTCSIVVKDILDKLNVDYDLLYCDSDPTFPHHHPDPSVSSNLVDIQKRVVDIKADLGIAVDADGDRVRIIDNNGNLINSDIYMLLMYRYLNSNLKVRKALYDVKCSKALIDELDKLNLEQIMYRTGNSYMYRKMHEENLDFAGEYSGHMWFGDRFYGFDDGIYAGLRIVEILSNTSTNLSGLLTNINEYYSTDELKLNTTEENKVMIVSKMKDYALSKNYKFNDIDGIRVEFDDSWALIRYSNTGPVLTVRFEANTEKRLEEIQKEFMDIINPLL